MFIRGLSKDFYLEIELPGMDYSKAGRNMVADLMSKWGVSWDQDVNKMDSVFKSETGGQIYVGGWEVRCCSVNLL